jgi:hypothetical protein
VVAGSVYCLGGVRLVFEFSNLANELTLPQLFESAEIDP